MKRVYEEEEEETTVMEAVMTALEALPTSSAQQASAHATWVYFQLFRTLPDDPDNARVVCQSILDACEDENLSHNALNAAGDLLMRLQNVDADVLKWDEAQEKKQREELLQPGDSTEFCSFVEKTWGTLDIAMYDRDYLLAAYAKQEADEKASLELEKLFQ